MDAKFYNLRMKAVRCVWNWVNPTFVLLCWTAGTALTASYPC